MPGIDRRSLAQVRSILVVRLDALGDVVLTGPFLRELRRAAPRARITLVVQPSAFNLVELCPYVDHILTFQGNLDRPSRPLLAWRFLVFCVRHIWTRRWDVAINPRFDVDSFGGTLLLWLSRAERRVGFSQYVTPEKAQHNPRHDRLLTDLVRGNAARHEVLHNLDIIRQLGGGCANDRLEIWASPDDQRAARRLTEQFADATRTLCAIAPGAGEPKRMWPAESFAAVTRVLCREFNCNVMVVGGPDAAGFGAGMERDFPGQVLNTAGRITLRQSAALLQRCELTISNDSGPMHLAAAAGSRVIAISCHPLAGDRAHRNSPIRFGPRDGTHIVLQPLSATPPCKSSCTRATSHCIRGVSPEQVLEACEQLLARGRIGIYAAKAPVTREQESPGILLIGHRNVPTSSHPDGRGSVSV